MISVKKKGLIYGVCVLCLTLGAGQSYAQIPSSADPSRQSIEGEQIAPRFDLQPQTILQSTTPELSPEIANLKFTLNSLTVNGNKAFAQNDLEAIYGSSLGQDISVGDVFTLLGKVQQLYLDEGFALSKVSMPEQNIQSGNITFEVVEGYIGGIEVSQGLPDTPMVHDFVSEVLAMTPLNVRTLERMMLILNDRPSVNVSSVLAPLDSESAEAGAIKLILKDNRNEQDAAPVMASLALDNYGSVFTGAGQAEGMMQIKDMGLNLSDLRLDAKVTTSLPELQQTSFDYTQPVFGVSGTNIRLRGSMSYTEPGASLDVLDIKGRSRSAGIEIEYPLIRQRHQNLIISAGFTYRNAETDLLQTEIINDRLRVINAGMNYSASDRFRGLNFINFSLSKGMDILNSSKTGSADLSRQDGRSDFTKIEASYTRVQSLAPDFDLFFSAAGQYSPHPLLSSEEFGYGGMGFGRGYDPSEITGDRGISASLELRYTPDINIPEITLQPFMFYDIGKVWNIDPSGKDKRSGASAGFGFRLRHNEGWAFDTTLAAPLTLNASNPPKYSDEDGLRVLFRLKKEF